MKVLGSFVLVLACFLGFFSLSSGQGVNYCTPTTDINPRCREILPYTEYFVPAQFNVTEEELVVNATELLTLADTPLVPPSCRHDLVRLICMSSFRECTPVASYLIPTILQGLKEGISANIALVLPYAGVSNIFSTFNRLFPTLKATLFNDPTFVVPTYNIDSISKFWTAYTNSTSPVYLAFSDEAIRRILYGTGVNEPVGFITDPSGRAVLGFLQTAASNTTDFSELAANYSCNPTQLQALLQWITEYAIPVVVPLQIQLIYGGEEGAILSAFLNQWANASLAPTGLDPSIPNFEVGSQFNGNIVVTNISSSAARALWDPLDENSLTNATGFARWLRALRRYQYYGTMDNYYVTALGLTSQQVQFILTWLGGNEATLFPALLSQSLPPEKFAQVMANVASTFACNSVCQSVHTNCAEFAAENGVALPDCSVPNKFVPVPDYPLVGNELGLDNATSIFIGCEAGEQFEIDVTVTEADINCTDATLVFVEAYPPCAEPCELLFWGQKKLDIVRTIGSVCSLISLVSSILLIINLVLRKFFAFPRNLPLFIGIASLFISVGFLIGFFGRDKVFCQSPSERTDFAGACAFSAFLIHYFALCATMWWLLITTNLFLSVVVKVKNANRQRMAVIFYLLGWALPAVPVIIALGLNAYAYDGKSPWCFLRSHLGYELGLFYIPVLTVNAIGAVIIFWIVYKVIQSTLASKGYVSSGKRAKLPRETYRLLAFLFLFMYIYSFVYAYRFSLMAIQSELTDDFQTWATCKLKAQFDLTITDCPRGKVLDYGLYVVFVMNTTLQGLSIAIFFGVTKENFRWLKTLITERRLPSEKSLRSTGADTSGQTERSKGNSVEQDVEMK